MKNVQKKAYQSLEHVKNPFIAIHHEIDRAMNSLHDMFEPHKFNLQPLFNSNLLPSMDLVDDKDSFKVECEMPGLDENDIKISVDNNILTIQGEKSISKKNENKNYISREINYGCYERRIELPRSVDTDKIHASFKKGMLWVILPKIAGAEKNSKAIKIEKAK